MILSGKNLIQQTMQKIKRISLLLLAILISTGCSSIMTNTRFYEPVYDMMSKGKFNDASKFIADAAESGDYSEKDRVLEYLDKGIVLHYSGSYKESNIELQKAEDAISELFTKSVSRGAQSFLLNDNSLAYDGEVYDNLYINVFKALNYVHLGMFDEAYVEIKRVNVKLRELDAKYDMMVSELDKSEKADIDLAKKSIDYYNNAMANYLSHLVFRADNEEDNSRISLEKVNEAWKQYPDVYNFPEPKAVTNTSNKKGSFLNILAFTGNAPQKKAIGARITTGDNFIVISDPTNMRAEPIPFPAVSSGWNFKFSFPSIEEPGSNVGYIDVYVNGKRAASMELLENISNVATRTFDTKKNIVYFKTAIRAVVKGIAAGKLGKNLEKQAGGGFLGGLAQLATNVAFDLTENADLRSWRTLPGYSFVTELDLEPGTYNIELHFLNHNEKLLYKKEYKNFNVKRGLNLIEAYYLN